MGHSWVPIPLIPECVSQTVFSVAPLPRHSWADARDRDLHLHIEELQRQKGEVSKLRERCGVPAATQSLHFLFPHFRRLFIPE